MTRRRSATYCVIAAAMMRVSCAQAGVWGVDPVIGITGDYSTNAALLIDPPPHTAAAHGAVLLDSPTTYNGDAFQFSVLPSFRFSDSAGYSSLASNYEHLTVKGEFDTERSVFTASGSVNRDSSLYQDYLSDGSAGVQRDTLLGGLDWQRSLTERLDFNTDVNWTRVRYSQTAGVGTLTDFKYLSIAPGFTWKGGERNKLSAAASVSRYDSLDGSTESRSANLQLGYVRLLTELWSVETDIGYSRALNQLDFDEQFLVFTPSGPAIETIPVHLESSQNGTVYSVVLSRKGTLLTFNAAASRQLVPSGFAFLSRQTSFQATANYNYSDRWSFNLDAHYLKAQDAQLRGGTFERTPIRLALGTSWRWTEHWTATLSVSRITERVQPPRVNLASNEVSMTLTRRFDHIKFQ
jgi:hypothetical protein